MIGAVLATSFAGTAFAVIGAITAMVMAGAALGALPPVRRGMALVWRRNVQGPKEERLIKLIKLTQEPMHVKLDNVDLRLEVLELRTEQLLPNGGNSLADKVNKVKAVIAPEPGDPPSGGPASES